MIAVLYTRPAAASLLRLSFSRHVARAHDRSIFGVGLLALAPWALVFAATRERQLLLMVVSGVADAADVALHPSAYTQPVIVLLMLKSASQATVVGSVRGLRRPERLRITGSFVPGVPPALAREPPRRVESRQPCGKRRPLRPPRRCSRRPLPRPWRRNPRLWRSRGRVAAAQLSSGFRSVQPQQAGPAGWQAWASWRHQGRVGRLRLRRRGARLRLRRHHLGRRRRRNGRMRRHGRSGEIRWEHLLCRISLLVRHVRNG